MGDEKLRQLERRWRETGSAADEAGWLRERARTGNLEPERLRLAAYLGHEPARIAAPKALGDFASRLGTLGGPFKDAMTPLGCYEHPPCGILAEWSTILPEESMEVCVRLSVATSRAALLACSDPVIQTWGNEVIAAIETWLDGPRTPDSLRTLAGYWWSHTRNHPRSTDPSADAIGWALMTAQVLSSYDPEGTPAAPDAEDEFKEFCKERAKNRAWVVDVFAGAQHALGEERTSEIETAVREDLVPWLLGNGDPVAERGCAPGAEVVVVVVVVVVVIGVGAVVLELIRLEPRQSARSDLSLHGLFDGRERHEDFGHVPRLALAGDREAEGQKRAAALGPRRLDERTAGELRRTLALSGDVTIDTAPAISMSQVVFISGVIITTKPGIPELGLTLDRPVPGLESNVGMEVAVRVGDHVVVRARVWGVDAGNNALDLTSHATEAFEDLMVLLRPETRYPRGGAVTIEER